MDLSQEILSNITVFNKYAKYIPEIKRRETWQEICERNMAMHIHKFPMLKEEIKQVYRNFVIPKKVLPSMRSLQFGGLPIELSNNRIFNCFTEDTSFITSQGTASFKDFNDGDIVTVPTHTGKWKQAVVKNYGMGKVNKIVFKKGRSEKIVYATENHRWLLRDGSETTSLSTGDILFKTPDLFSFDYASANPFEKLYWCYGYVFGDGTLVDGKHSMVRLCGKDSDKYSERFVEMGFITSQPLSCAGDFIAYTGKYLKTAPNPKVDSVKMIQAFVAGYCDADAYKNPNWYAGTTNQKYKTIQASGSKYFTFIDKCFEMAGQYVLSKEDLTGQETNFGIRPETYRYNINSSLCNTPATSWVCSEISQCKEDVSLWCLEVEDDHSFILSGGLVTGNCAFSPADDPAVFSETMFNLLSGSGVGYSVQHRHVDKLPVVKGVTNRTKKFLIDDSITGWSDAVKALCKAYFNGKPEPVFDYRAIREKGAKLVTSGGKAPGPEPLRICIEHLRGIFNNAVGRRLKPIEVHDMLCHISDSVLSGGIRRSACIVLFDFDDMDMLTCKSGEWWELNPQRGRANNSVVLKRGEVTREQWDFIWKRIQDSGCGEPGIFWTNDYDIGTNPCCEISLRSNSFCNLTTQNVSDVETQEELNARSKASAFLGTLQAAYTDFPYLRDVWKQTTEEDALLGVSMTGIGSGKVEKLDLEEAAEIVKWENSRVANIIGINPAKRCTTIKPEGTSSLVLGCSSGVHAWHAPYYIRRMRVGKNEALYQYMKSAAPKLIEDCQRKPHIEAVMSFPQKAPEGSVFRTEPALSTLERVKHFHSGWVKPGHVEGENTHNVSCTISVRDEEWKEVGEWMWNNKDSYTGISVLPYFGGTYPQLPFEDCSEETYNEMFKLLSSIDLTQVVEEEDETNLNDQVACGGGSCEVK